MLSRTNQSRFADGIFLLKRKKGCQNSDQLLYEYCTFLLSLLCKMKHGSQLFSPRHAKGCLTLALVLLAESVAITNAVKLWGSYKGGNKNRESPLFDTPFSRASREVQECVESDNESCPSMPSPSLSAARRPTLGRLTRRAVLGTKAFNCCSDCSHLLTGGGQCTNIPRGGSIAEATVDGSNAVMPYGIPLNGWKVIFQAFLTTLNVLCWLIPLRSKKISENKLGLSLANAFSGGVFLSLAFGHLIPECVHGFEGYNEVTPYLLVLSGYLLIFFVEKVAFDTHEILNEMENADEKKVANGDANQGSTSGRSAIILLGALAVHSVLEMAALGLADTFGDSAILTLSIALHQVRIVIIICHDCAQIF